LIPFEDFETRWKIITLDGQNPLRKEYDPSAYPLAITYSLHGDPALYKSMLVEKGANRILAASDRDAEQMTVLLMTGVTALVRATGWMMDTRGVEFPASSIGDILRAADITHISNEVSFSPDCPVADPGSGSLRFCSDPKYFDLLTIIDADIVELSGNHVNDWGLEAMQYSLDLYHEAGIPYYSGGKNQEQARQAVILEDHGNRLGFIGCNEAGPGFAWATNDSPGSAACDLDWMESEVSRLKSEGIIPVVTFQYEESYSPQPMPWQVRDFQRIAAAGAGLVSGSQAHSPQIFEFHLGSFIHYGPGNLFFDQMNVPELPEATRWEFLDRYTIYRGKIIGVEVLTAMLEDWSRPRLMTPEERYDLLSWIFTESGWNPDK
jgi:poly-gamma-glutamate synthesis protein (capsule biosynthesis protein)